MGQIEITAAQVRAKAEELSNQNSQLKAQITLLEETEQSLGGMWDGEAKLAFHSAFERDKAQLLNFYTTMQQYITALQNAAIRYEQAESQNLEIINSGRR